MILQSSGLGASENRAAPGFGRILFGLNLIQNLSRQLRFCYGNKSSESICVIILKRSVLAQLVVVPIQAKLKFINVFTIDIETSEARPKLCLEYLECIQTSFVASKECRYLCS